MASVATGPSKLSFQCLYRAGSVRKSTRPCSPSVMSAPLRISENDPERLGPLHPEILPSVGRAAVAQRAVAGLEHVMSAAVLQGDLAADYVEHHQRAGLDDGLRC